MGSESSKSNSNSSESDSESSSNSGKKDERLETMECQPQNSDTTINRVWIVKKSICLNNKHVKIIEFKNIYLLRLLSKNKIKKAELIRQKKNIFNIENSSKGIFMHWAIILELSNDSYVNIQFGRNGFSLKEFNKTENEGENVLNAILNTWGEENHPFSFCYLGYANYEYEKFKNILRKIKENELKNFNENGKTFYNVCFKNCQHFACDIEKILFERIQVWHSFDYYLEDFFKKFFSNINIKKLKLKADEIIENENEKIFKENLKTIAEYGEKIKESVSKKRVKEILKDLKIELEELFGIKIKEILDE